MTARSEHRLGKHERAVRLWSHKIDDRDQGEIATVITIAGCVHLGSSRMGNDDEQGLMVINETSKPTIGMDCLWSRE